MYEIAKALAIERGIRSYESRPHIVGYYLTTDEIKTLFKEHGFTLNRARPGRTNPVRNTMERYIDIWKELSWVHVQPGAYFFQMDVSNFYDNEAIGLALNHIAASGREIGTYTFVGGPDWI